MAIVQRAPAGLASIVDELERAVRRRGLTEAGSGSSKGILRIELERDVRRVIQVYWTPFEANVPGQSIGVHVEVAEPRVHWAECYLSQDSRNWVFCFAERPDGEMQLSYHADYATPSEAIESFWHLAGWYVLTATDLTWDDVSYELGEGIAFAARGADGAPSPASPAVQESLKKSTILWLRYELDGVEQTMPVWYLYDAKAGRIYVLSGERQQTIPGADQLRDCYVILRWKGKNASVAKIPATVRALQPGPQWDEVAEKIAEKRLNIPGLPEETARRWRDECTILELSLEG
jgi:hypothetical protein